MNFNFHQPSHRRCRCQHYNHSHPMINLRWFFLDISFFWVSRKIFNQVSATPFRKLVYDDERPLHAMQSVIHHYRQVPIKCDLMMVLHTRHKFNHANWSQISRKPAEWTPVNLLSRGYIIFSNVGAIEIYLWERDRFQSFGYHL